jgi:fucose 4-O-acetylase-like acetyltransferase
LITWRSRFSELPKAKIIIYTGIAILVLLVLYMTLLLGCSGQAVTLFRKLSTGMHTMADIKWAFGFGGVNLIAVLTILRLAHYISVAIICFCVAKVLPASKTPIAKWGENSLQVYISHLLLLYAIDGTCGLGAIASSFGVNSDIGYFIFFAIGGVLLTVFLAASSLPNEWVAALKGLMLKGPFLKS